MKAAIVAILLAGCTTTLQHPDPRADFERDYYQCQKDAAPIQEQPRRYDVEQRCMRIKGWRPA